MNFGQEFNLEVETLKLSNEWGKVSRTAMSNQVLLGR